MKTLKNGFSAVEIILAAGIVVVVGLVAWRVWDANNQPSTDNNQVTTQDNVPRINDASDLDKASETLENTNIEGNYESELESATNY